jgi:hypothetical protein
MEISHNKEPSVIASDNFQISKKNNVLTSRSKPSKKYVNHYIRKNIVMVVVLFLISNVLTWFAIKNILQFFVFLIFINMPISFGFLGWGRYFGKFLLRRDYLDKLRNDVKNVNVIFSYPKIKFDLRNFIAPVMILTAIALLRFNYFGTLSPAIVVLFPLIIIPIAFVVTFLNPIVSHLKWVNKGEINLETNSIHLWGHHWFYYDEIFNLNDIEGVALYKERLWFTNREAVGIYIIARNIRHLVGIFFAYPGEEGQTNLLEEIHNFLKEFFSQNEEINGQIINLEIHTKLNSLPPSGRLLSTTK